MKVFKNLIANIVISWILLYVFNYYSIWIKITFTDAETTNSIIKLVWVFLVLGLIFWVFNTPIKWILKTLSCPINFLTLWLVSIAINVLVFYLFAYFTNNFFDWELTIKLWEIWQTLILSVIMWVAISILKKIL
jgi:uncharacterized membrane protein YvlD (DUF360 family)